MSKEILTTKKLNTKSTAKKDWMASVKQWSKSFSDKHNHKSEKQFVKWLEE